MSEPFYITNKKYKNGIVLENYKGVLGLVRGYEGNDGKIYKRWGFPEKDKSPSSKAIPWKIELGDEEEAVKVLEYFLGQLKGDEPQDTPPPVDEEPPF